MKEHTKLCQKQLSKVTLHFVWGQLSRKQKVALWPILRSQININTSWLENHLPVVKELLIHCLEPELESRCVD